MNGPFPQLVTNQNGFVFFEPLADDFSIFPTPYTTFSYRACDTIACSSPGAVPVHVTPKPDSPTCINDNFTADATVDQVIFLNATDPDVAVFSGTFTIATLPSTGQLYEVVAGGISGVAGALINAGNHLITGPYKNRVIYRPRAGNPGETGQDVLYSTSFTFTATDSSSLPSGNIGTIRVDVKNSLKAISDVQTGDEDTDISIILHSWDRENVAGTTYFITQLPAKGALSFAGGLVITGPIAVPAGGALTFRPLENENGPTYATLSFYAVRGNDPNWKSFGATVRINVNPVNDDPIINFPAEVIVPFLKDVMVPVNITDPDSNTQLWTIKITSSLATLSLNPTVHDKIPGAQLRPRETEGFYLGDGDHDQDVEFWTYLSTLNEALNPFIVHGSGNEATGTITLTVNDLDPTLPGPRTATATIIVKIVASDKSGPGAKATDGFPPWVQYTVWSGGGAIVLGCCACLFYKQIYVRIKKRSAQTTAQTYAVSL
jgi:hypothetical protein